MYFFSWVDFKAACADVLHLFQGPGGHVRPASSYTGAAASPAHQELPETSKFVSTPCALSADASSWGSGLFCNTPGHLYYPACGRQGPAAAGQGQRLPPPIFGADTLRTAEVRSTTTCIIRHLMAVLGFQRRLPLRRGRPSRRPRPLTSGGAMPGGFEAAISWRASACAAGLATGPV